MLAQLYKEVLLTYALEVCFSLVFFVFFLILMDGFIMIFSLPRNGKQREITMWWLFHTLEPKDDTIRKSNISYSLRLGLKPWFTVGESSLLYSLSFIDLHYPLTATCCFLCVVEPTLKLPRPQQTLQLASNNYQPFPILPHPHVTSKKQFHPTITIDVWTKALSSIFSF